MREEPLLNNPFLANCRRPELRERRTGDVVDGGGGVGEVGQQAQTVDVAVDCQLVDLLLMILSTNTSRGKFAIKQNNRHKEHLISK